VSKKEIEYRKMSYDEFVDHVEVIAAAVEEGDWRPDFIVGVGRGGLVPGTYLSHRLDIPLLSIDHSSKVHAFSDALLVHLAACTKLGEKYLFIDDINDSGKTLARFRHVLAEQGAVADNIRFGVMINNVCSIETVEYASENIDRSVHKFWFVFPWGALASKAAREKDAREDPSRLGLED